MINKAEPTADTSRLPVVVERADSTDGAFLHLDVPADLAWFYGHFPSDPILPGVAQIGWAIAFARERFGLGADPIAIERVKFFRSVRPNERLTLELKLKKIDILWQYTAGDIVLSRGRLIFETA